jgi:release factor glutamine methyltransferase
LLSAQKWREFPLSPNRRAAYRLPRKQETFMLSAAVPDPPATALPSLAHLESSGAYARVYEPQEDTWLFCDALAADAPRLRAALPALVVEVGPGSGAVGVALLRLLAAPPALAPPVAVAVDINFSACAAAASTAAAAAPPPLAYEAVCGDLLTALLPRLAGAVDVLLFNPPYVPTPAAEVPSAAAMAGLAARAVARGGAAAGSAASGGGGGGDDDGVALSASWAGGERGRAVLDRLLAQLPVVLAQPRGVAYLVLLADNAPREVAAALARAGLRCELVARRRAANEELLIARVEWAA